jgi:uncharacterized protein YecE (DUF72 family)
MKCWVGTSGFSYKEWKGSFYPEDLPNDRMLAYYGERLNAVEINNTFYRMPKRATLADWAGKVPDDFSFVLKASRKITHFKRLKETRDELGCLVDVSSELGPRLGPILFQLPPNLKIDVERLRDFVSLFPAGFRAAFEFRNDSWFTDETYSVLGDAGAALVTADTGTEEPAEVVATAPYGYLRLRREVYEPGDVARWARVVSDQEWEDAFVFFKHEDAGAGPALAERFVGELA